MSKDYIYPDWLDRNEYPFESHYFDSSVGKIHYIDEGEGDPVVMVHGNPGWSFEFRNIIKEMSKTHRCIAVDHIGFGLSDKPSDFDYLPKSHAKNFELFMNRLNLQNITMTFNDWGGPIGLSYAIKYPEKFKKIVIMNTFLWSVKDDPHYRKFSKLMGGKFGRFMIKNFNIFGNQFLPKVFGDKEKLPTHIHKHYYKHFEKRSERKGCYVFPREVTQSGDWLNSLWKQKEKINSIPTKIVWGMKDIAFREKELNTWINNWKSAELIKLENVGHYPHEEFPDIIINALKD